MFDANKIWETVVAVLLAAAGGLARLLSRKDESKMKWGRIFSELFISGFSGLIICLVARASGATGEWIGVAAGVSGWIGPRVLDAVIGVISKMYGVDLPDDKDKKDE